MWVPIRLVLYISCATACAAGAHSAFDLDKLVAKVNPAIVAITTQTKPRSESILRDPDIQRIFDTPDLPQRHDTISKGSGVIVDSDAGLIITTHHVIANSGEIFVILKDGRRFDASVIGSDQDVDLALLMIPAENLPTLPWADSDKLRVGDFILIMGTGQVQGERHGKVGIISALGRSGLGLGNYEDFILIDKSIRPMDSGGPLVRLDGSLVGINTAVVGPEGENIGLGLAIPSNLTREVVAQIIEFGSSRRSHYGLHLQRMTPKIAKRMNIPFESGIAVVQVDRNSPAGKSELRAGDIIRRIDGAKVNSLSAVQDALFYHTQENKVMVDVIRDGRKKAIQVKIHPLKHTDAQVLHPKLHGAAIGSINISHPMYSRLQGIEVLRVERGGGAWQIGLRTGDIIVGINKQPVTGLEDGMRASKERRDTLLLNVRRMKRDLFFYVR